MRETVSEQLNHVFIRAHKNAPYIVTMALSISRTNGRTCVFFESSIKTAVI